MHAPSLYLDTSVIGGYHDPEFMADTRKLWRLQAAGRFRFYASDLVIEEFRGAPPRLRELMDAPFGAQNLVVITSEQLATAYLGAKVVSAKYVDDAQHVAACSIAGLDYLGSGTSII